MIERMASGAVWSPEDGVYAWAFLSAVKDCNGKPDPGHGSVRTSASPLCTLTWPRNIHHKKLSAFAQVYVGSSTHGWVTEAGHRD